MGWKSDNYSRNCTNLDHLKYIVMDALLNFAYHWFRYGDVEGCGIQCENPLFSEREHDVVHLAVAIAGSLCAACTLFTVVGLHSSTVA